MRKISPIAGWALAITFASLPAAYLLYLEIPFFTPSFNYLMLLLGRMSALFGMSLFAVTFLLITRLDFLEDLFGGFDRVYAAHRAFGVTAFISLLVHPLALASTYLVTSVALAARFFLPVNDFSSSLGIFSLLTMELFLVFTFFARIKHQHWKSVHRFLGVSFFLGSLHVLLTSVSTMGNVVIRASMVAMILVGSVSYLYRSVLWQYLVKQYPYRIESIAPIGSAITELVLSPEKEAISFTPGQFVYISLASAIATCEQHPFTISSSASDRMLRVSIKSLGDYTSDLKDIRAGAKVKVEGPYGRFCPSFSNEKDQVWIAGGIGITPFLSMARSIETHPVRNVDMYYCAGCQEEAIFLDELKAISSRNPNLNLIPFFSSERGRLNGKCVSEASKDLKDREVFICGPAPMMQSLRSQFRGMGLPGKAIRMEEFGL